MAPGTLVAMHEDTVPTTVDGDRRLSLARAGPVVVATGASCQLL